MCVCVVVVAVVVVIVVVVVISLFVCLFVVVLFFVRSLLKDIIKLAGFQESFVTFNTDAKSVSAQLLCPVVRLCFQ